MLFLPIKTALALSPDIIHSFELTDEVDSLGDLTLYNGKLYGASSWGGSSGRGFIFSVNPDGTAYTVIKRFLTVDYSEPTGIQVTDSKIFWLSARTKQIMSMDLNGDNLTILHSLNTTTSLYSGLYHQGTELFGTACSEGTHNSGFLFKINTDGTQYQVIHNFEGLPDGDCPVSRPILIGDVIYGHTWYGGNELDGATIYSINKDGTNYQVIYRFSGAGNLNGTYSGLTYYNDRLYGTVTRSNVTDESAVYSINMDGTDFQLLHSLVDYATEGCFISSSVIISNNKIIGISGYCGIYDKGTIFTMNLDGTSFEVLRTMLGAPSDGSEYENFSPPVLYNNALYLLSNTGGANDYGAIVKYSLPDTTAPVGTVTLNDSKNFTKDRLAYLIISSTDGGSGVSEMMLSESPDFSGINWESYSASKQFTLSSGDGSKTVYARFKDFAGNISDTVSDSIILDTVVGNPVITQLGLITNVPDKSSLYYYFTSQTPIIRGTSEPLSTVHFKYLTNDYTATTDSAGLFTISIPTLPREFVTLTYFAVDQAGNTSDSKVLKLMIGVENFPVTVTDISNPVIEEPTETPTTEKPTDPDNEEMPVITKIQIFNPDNEPLVNTEVMLNNKAYTTDANGFIYAKDLKAGKYTISLKSETEKLKQEFSLNNEQINTGTEVTLAEAPTEEAKFQWWWVIIPLLLVIVAAFIVRKREK